MSSMPAASTSAATRATNRRARLRRTPRAAAAVWLLALLLALTGCSLIGGSSGSSGSTGGDTGGDSSGAAPTKVVLVTHESFALPDALIAAFEKDSGLTLDIQSAGDAGTLTNKLVLTKDSPTGDVAFGVDNTFASRALDAGVFASYEGTLPDGAADYQLPTGSGGAPEDRLVPIDNGNVCINVDKVWFAERDLPLPRTLDDLTQKRYRNLTVLPGAATSSPGMAFLLATISAYGEDGWADYWTRLMANGVKLTAGWSDAYFVDFTQGGGQGKRPIVLSYDSSPAFTVPEGGGASTTAALLDTCFRQVEYAGILAGAANPDGARQVIDWLLSAEVQAALPDNMYVFPVRSDVEVPQAWAQYAVQPAAPATLDPQLITAQRDAWLRQWTDITTR